MIPAACISMATPFEYSGTWDLLAGIESATVRYVQFGISGQSLDFLTIIRAFGD